MAGSAPVVDLNGEAAGTSTSLDYTENQPLTPIAPGASVLDSDSPTFANGALAVAFTLNGTADDQLRVIDEGQGVGKISVSEDSIFYNFGHLDGEGNPIGPELIGTYTPGDGFSPLNVFLNDTATAEAVQALLEAIGYLN